MHSGIERQMSQQAAFERHFVPARGLIFTLSAHPDSSHMAALCQADATRASSGSKVTYKAGDLIVAADPFVFVLNPELRGQRCDHCLRKRSVLLFCCCCSLICIITCIRDKLKRCSGCSLLQYCDKKCQTADWKSYHKNGECDFYHKLSACADHKVVNFFQWNHYASVLLRLFLLIRAKPDLMFRKFRLHDGNERCLNDLMDDEHDEDRSGMNPLKFHLIYSALSQVDSCLIGLPEFGFLKSLFHKLRINSFTITGMEQRVGHALYIQSSVFDHSCRANAAYVFKGKRMEVRAMRDVAEGEEIRIQYVNTIALRDERRDKLWKGWGFVCACDRCEEGEEDEQEKRELAADTAFHESMAAEQLNQLSDEERADFIFRGLIEVLPIKEKCVGPFHPHLTECMYRAVNAKCTQRNMSAADMRDFVALLQKLQTSALITHGKDHEFDFMIPVLRATAGLSLE